MMVPIVMKQYNILLVSCICCMCIGIALCFQYVVHHAYALPPAQEDIKGIKDFAPDGTIVTDVNQRNIEINLNFSGSLISIYGAIKRKRILPVGDRDTHVIVVFRSKSEPYIVNKRSYKYRVFPVNTYRVPVHIPSIYSIASSRSISEIIDEDESIKFRIGARNNVNYNALDNAGNILIDKEVLNEMLDEVVKLQTEAGKYLENPLGVRMTEDTLFRSDLRVPENVVEGLYVVEFFLVENKRVVDMKKTFITLRKSGIERFVYSLANMHPYLYAIILVSSAIVCGWGAARLCRFR